MRATQGGFLDLASEEVASSSGILLTDRNLGTLVERYDIEELRGLERGERETVIRPEDFEDAVLKIRVGMGNLPDSKMGQLGMIDKCIALEKKGIDSKKLCEAYLAISESGKYATVTDKAIEEIISARESNRSSSWNFWRRYLRCINGR